MAEMYEQATSPFMPTGMMKPLQPDELFRLRIVHRKRGRLAMLSHLEVLRAMERTVRRAGLPFAITQGFSPHMKTSFGSALPVGVGGVHEMFDVFLTRFVDPTEAFDALRAASVPDLQVESVEYVDFRAPAPNIQFPVSVYEVILDRPVAHVHVPETISVVRKKKERVLQVSEYLLHGPVVTEDNLERPCVEFALMVRQSGSLRPDAFVTALLAGTGAHTLSVTRTRQLPSIFALG